MREIAAPKYDLNSHELAALSDEISRAAQGHSDKAGMTAVWIQSDSEAANFIRTHEARNFPEVSEVSDDDEKLTTFLALLDCRTETASIVHAATLCNSQRAMVRNDNRRTEGKARESTGFICIDELIELGNFTSEEFYSYYASRGFDLCKSISVETNFKIVRKVEPYFGMGMADLMYYCIFSTLKQNGGLVDQALVFATINKMQIKSFERIGISFKPLLGRVGMKTAESELGVNSFPSVLIYNSRAEKIFSSLTVPYEEFVISRA